MAFWTDPDLREPLRQNRWYIIFGNEQLQYFIFALKSCSKPEYKIETTQHVLLNHTFNYPKNLVWSPVQITMVAASAGASSTNVKNGDIIPDGSLSTILQDNIKNSGYNIPSDADTNQLNKNNMVDALKSVQIIQVDANGEKIDTWDLFNPMITSVKYGDLSYENENFVDINFSIVYDYAEHDKGRNWRINPEIIKFDSSGPDKKLKSSPTGNFEYNSGYRLVNPANLAPIEG